MENILVLGATPNEERYAYKACQLLQTKGYNVVPVGIKEGNLVGKKIITNKDIQTNIHTITMYVSEANQKNWYNYILTTKPKRIIFNPGTENAELEKLAKEEGIETEQACTLVLLSTNQF